MNGLQHRLRKEFKDKEYAHAYVKEFLNASIATQIKVLREQRGWEQQELASITGMRQPRISLLENINYSMWSISTLQKLAEAFDVTLIVSFETFSDRITDMHNLSRESLERLPRMDDLSFSEEPMEEMLASTNQPNLRLDDIDESIVTGLQSTPKMVKPTLYNWLASLRVNTSAYSTYSPIAA